MPSLTLMKRRLQGHKASNEKFQQLDLRSMDAFGSTWEDCEFHSCRFQMANLANSTFTNVKFIGCDFSMANFNVSRFTGCRIAESQMEQTSFQGTVIRDTHFDENRLNYSTFAGSTLRGKCSMKDCNFHGADLSFLEADHVDFTGSLLWGAKIVLGCAFFGAGEFDKLQVKRFAGMLANAKIPVEEHVDLVTLADEQLPVMARLIRREKHDHDE